MAMAVPVLIADFNKTEKESKQKLIKIEPGVCKISSYAELMQRVKVRQISFIHSTFKVAALHPPQRARFEVDGMRRFSNS
jgi:hypothetical protein